MELVIFSDIITVHPHVCGEHSAQTFASRRFGRFIPTCVGNMAEDEEEPEAAFGSSPRVWGTLNVTRKVFCIRIGSSPRVWGT